MGSWYLALLVIGVSSAADPYIPIPQMWGPFWSRDSCVAAFERARADSRGDWHIIAAECQPGPTPPRQMEVRHQREDGSY